MGVMPCHRRGRLQSVPILLVQRRADRRRRGCPQTCRASRAPQSHLRSGMLAAEHVPQRSLPGAAMTGPSPGADYEASWRQLGNRLGPLEGCATQSVVVEVRHPPWRASGMAASTCGQLIRISPGYARPWQPDAACLKPAATCRPIAMPSRRQAHFDRLSSCSCPTPITRDPPFT